MSQLNQKRALKRLTVTSYQSFEDQTFREHAKIGDKKLWTD